MGGGASKSNGNAANSRGGNSKSNSELAPKFESLWDQVDATADDYARHPGEAQYQSNTRKRRQWKAVRLFISSTFKDFHNERLLFETEIFPDLRAWCEKRRIHIVDCDLRWGIPDDCKKGEVLRACMQELERCYDENGYPYMCAVIGDRVGWIPEGDEILPDISRKYHWVDGMSMTEMEIVYGAYRAKNPNTLFMFRDPSFISQLNKDMQLQFVDSKTAGAQAKLEQQRKRIEDRFPNSQIMNYKVQVQSQGKTDGVRFSGLESFKKNVLDFFMQRIDEQYPEHAVSKDPIDQYPEFRDAQVAFVLEKAKNVVGREQQINEIQQLLGGQLEDPILLVGEPGCGKTTILCSIVANLLNQRGGHQLFFHFVGSTPESIDIEQALSRFIAETYNNKLPEDAGIGSLTIMELQKPVRKPLIMVIDELNMFSEEHPHMLADKLTWLPIKLSKNVKLVFSMTRGTRAHNMLMKRYPGSKQIMIPLVNEESQRSMVDTLFSQKLHRDIPSDIQEQLLRHEGSANPLWLMIACEELNYCETPLEMEERVRGFPGDLVDLEMQILSRLESGDRGDQIAATLCLLETQTSGLLESEIRDILSEDELDDAQSMRSPLAAYKWAIIFYKLKPYLRPFGASGALLDFYRRSFGQAVRQKYFSQSPDAYDDYKEGDREASKLAKQWHKLLAEFFQYRCDNWDRKVESLPRHFLALGDYTSLREFIKNYSVLDRLFDPFYSTTLIKLWRLCADTERMCKSYTEMARDAKNNNRMDKDELAHMYYKVASICKQVGQYDLAEEFYESCIQLEQNMKERSQTRLADLYLLKYDIITNKRYSQDPTFNRQDIVDTETQIDLMKKGIATFERSASDNIADQMGLAMALRQLADEYGTYLEVRYDFPKDVDANIVKEALDKVVPTLEKSQKIYEELGDMGSVGLCKNSRGLLKGEKELQPKIKENAIDLFFEAEKLVGQYFGPDSVSLAGVYKNIVEECSTNVKDAKKQQDAYTMLKKWHKMCKTQLGQQHAQMQACLAYFQEPWVKNLAKQKNEPCPPT